MIQMFFLLLIGITYSIEAMELPETNNKQNNIHGLIIPYDKVKHQTFLRHILQHDTDNGNKNRQNCEITDDYITEEINEIEKTKEAPGILQTAKLKFVNDLPVAFIEAWKQNDSNEMWLRFLVVSPNYRRKGYGTELLETVAKEFQKKCTCIHVTLSREKCPSDRFMKFIEKNGFVFTEGRTHWLIYTKQISQE